MARKKESDSTLTADEQNQVQIILAHYTQLANNLSQSSNSEQALATLSTITDAPETVQIALLKELSRQHETAAADILLALNELSADKNIRKEARRSLIRLEEAKVYPEWQAPVAHTPIIQLPVANAPRFWKGIVTQCREEGEIQLALFWEQGLDYSEVRVLTFLLDFWERGIKDFIAENSNRRNADARLQEMRTKPPGITLTDCTLAEGRRLLAEARSVNQWRGTPIQKEYRHHLPIINQLIWDAADVGEDRGLTFINPNLEPDEVAGTFVGGWSLGDYGMAYDLLSKDSSLRDGMEREEWLELRRTWANEAHPTRFELNYIREIAAKAPTLWLPNTFGSRNVSSRKEIDVAWALEISDSQLSGTLREMPMGTVVYKETGRHWFWTRYTLIQEQGQWRIQQMADEGAAAQGLAISELQQHIKESDERINALMQQSQQLDTSATQQQTEEIVWRMVQAMHYDDALIVKLPLDRTILGDAYNRAIGLGSLERAIVYLERMATNFSEARSGVLRQLGITQESLSEYYAERGMTEREQQFAALAKASLRATLDLEDSIAGRVILAEVILKQNNTDLNEAETLLNEAKTMAETPTEQALIEADLGNLAMQREQVEIALRHFQQAAEIDPNLTGIWFRIGLMQRTMQRFEDAKPAYERAIEQNPQDLLSYAELGSIYMSQQQFTKARELTEQGLRAMPKSVHLLAMLASIYLEMDDLRHARAVLTEAEQVNPNYELVQAVRDEMQRRISNKR